MKEKLEDLALEVKALGPAAVAAESGVRAARVSRFVNAPLSLTMRDLDAVTAAVARLRGDA